MDNIGTTILFYEGTNFTLQNKLRFKYNKILKTILMFLIITLFALFDESVCQQNVGISMCSNCDPLATDLFCYSQEADFMQQLLIKKPKRSNSLPLLSHFAVWMMSFH